MNINRENKKNAVIIAGGEIKDHARMRKLLLSSCGDNALIISADGGIYNTLKLGFKPHIVIGDMDSIGKNIKKKYGDGLSGVEFIPALREKDESDSQLAVGHAVGMGIKNITLAGAAGGRIDHTLANIMLLASPGFRDADIRILTETMEVFFVDRSCTIKGGPGKLISIFSLTPHTKFIKTDGLKYRLKNERLDLSPVRGLSNVFTGKEAALDFRDGKLLIIKEI